MQLMIINIQLMNEQAKYVVINFPKQHITQYLSYHLYLHVTFTLNNIDSNESLEMVGDMLLNRCIFFSSFTFVLYLLVGKAIVSNSHLIIFIVCTSTTTYTENITEKKYHFHAILRHILCIYIILTILDYSRLL